MSEPFKRRWTTIGTVAVGHNVIGLVSARLWSSIGLVSVSLFPSPETVFPKASGDLLHPLVYEWSPPDLYITGDDGQPVRQSPQTLYNVWASDPERNLCGFLWPARVQADAQNLLRSTPLHAIAIAKRACPADAARTSLRPGIELW